MKQKINSNTVENETKLKKLKYLKKWNELKLKLKFFVNETKITRNTVEYETFE